MHSYFEEGLEFGDVVVMVVVKLSNLSVGKQIYSLNL